jgi:hypothetical protein
MMNTHMRHQWLQGAHELADVFQTLPSSVQYAPAKAGGMSYDTHTLGIPARALRPLTRS